LTGSNTETFRTTITVRFGDVDSAGIVYFSRFLDYVHIALEEFFSKMVDIDYPDMIQQHRLGFPTAHLEMDFIRPLRYGDRVDVGVLIEKLGKTSAIWRYRLSLAGESEPATVARQVTVCTDMDSFEKREIPGWLRERLEP
jgi:4-hydroxybenzoyl-CoA thioesterase